MQEIVYRGHPHFFQVDRENKNTVYKVIKRLLKRSVTVGIPTSKRHHLTLEVATTSARNDPRVEQVTQLGYRHSFCYLYLYCSGEKSTSLVVRKIPEIVRAESASFTMSH
jgi:hypothetical protein